MRACSDTLSGLRTRSLIVLLWRSGLRISEALDLRETDLNERENSIFVRSGKGGRPRLVGMDSWGWHEMRPWLEERKSLPVGTVFPVVLGKSAGRRWNPVGARGTIKTAADNSGVRRRIHPHAFRHAFACELAREGVPIHIIQRQLGHANPGITAVYLQGISGLEVLDAIGARKPPMVPAW
jgi:site-specific recombinase XerD